MFTQKYVAYFFTNFANCKLQILQIANKLKVIKEVFVLSVSFYKKKIILRQIVYFQKIFFNVLMLILDWTFHFN